VPKATCLVHRACPLLGGKAGMAYCSPLMTQSGHEVSGTNFFARSTDGGFLGVNERLGLLV